MLSFAANQSTKVRREAAFVCRYEQVVAAFCSKGHQSATAPADGTELTLPQ